MAARSTCGSVLALALASCGPVARPLPPGAVGGADDEMPPWVYAPQGEGCDPAMVCTLGVATGAESPKAALDHARYDGYLRLAEQAFPVQVTRRYRSERRDETRRVRDEVHSELFGRLRHARQLDEFWVRRRVHTVDGATDVFDGWVRVAMDRERLSRLYAEEQARTREESRVERARVDEALAGLARDTAEAWAAALSVLDSATATAASLQDGPGKPELLAALAKLERALDGRLAIEATSAEARPDRAAAHVRFAVRAGDEPLGGVPLSVSAACAGRPATHVLRTDAAGEAALDVPMASRLAPCPVDVSVGAEGRLTRRVTLPAPWDCVRLRWRLEVHGHGSRAVRDGLDAGLTALAEELVPGTRRCDAASRRVEVVLSTEVTVHLEAPRRMAGRVWFGGGSTRVRVAVTAGARPVETFSSPPTPVKGVGLNDRQIRDGLETRILAIVKENVERSIAKL